MLMSSGFILRTKLKGFREASNILRLASRKFILRFKAMIGEKWYFFLMYNVIQSYCCFSIFFEECFARFSKPRVLEGLL